MLNLQNIKLKNLPILEISLPMSMFFVMYEIYSVSIAYLILLVSIICTLTFKKIKVVLDWYFILFTFLVILHGIFFYLVYDNILLLKNLYNVVFTFGIILLLSKNLNKRLFVRYYSFFAIIALIGLIYHSYQIYFQGLLVSPIIIFPNFLIDSNIAYNSYRPLSFFSEPQAYATFLIPLYTILIYKRKYMFSMILFISVIISGSSLGLIMFIIIPGIYYIFVNKNMKKKISKYLLFIFIVSVAFFQTNYFNTYLQKILSINITTDFRLANGFLIFNRLPLVNKIFGIGLGNIDNFLFINNIDFRYTYMTSFSGILVYFGVFYLLFFLIYLLRLYKKGNEMQKIFTIVISVLLFGQTLFYNIWFILYMITYYHLIKEKKER